MNFFYNYGAILERELSMSESNPGDISIDIDKLHKENTEANNTTCNKTNEMNREKNIHPDRDGNMSPKSNFEKQVDSMIFHNYSNMEDFIEEKQGKRSPGKERTRHRHAARWKNEEDIKGFEKNKATRSKRNQRAMKRENGFGPKEVEMTLERVVLNGQSESFSG